MEFCKVTLTFESVDEILFFSDVFTDVAIVGS